MLAGLSESLTLTLVVLLVLGSICYYLYSRILLNENRMSLIESLLMDLKMSNDLRAMDAQDNGDQNIHDYWPMNPAINRQNLGQTSEIKEEEEEDNDNLSDVIAKAVEIHTDNGVGAGAGAGLGLERAAEGGAVLLASADGPSLVSGQPINQDTPLQLNTVQLVSNVDNTVNIETDNADDSPFLDSLNDIKTVDSNQITNVPSSSLESMTVKELHSLAKQRRVPGESKMNRAELIEALR